ncbi:MAG: FKBP-type peptidyl-prolyl cis-trans isomerase [Chlamydiales bacterium]
MFFLKILIPFFVFLSSITFASLSFTNQEIILLEKLFQCLFKETMCGYVFYDEKPMAIQPYSLADTMFNCSRFHKTSVAIAAAKEVIEKPCFKNRKIIISFDAKADLILVINKDLFLQTIQDNISLFQYVLGPNIESESLLAAILKDGFLNTLKNDSALIGIILGYGVQNSLYVAREEEIYISNMMQPSLPPLKPKEEDYRFFLFSPSESFQENRGIQLYTTQKPSFGFSTLSEESEFLSKMIKTSSEMLLNNKPEFVFGHVPRDAETSKKIKDFEKTQANIQNELESPTFIKDILYKTIGETIEIPDIIENKIPLEQIDYNTLFAKYLKQSFKDQKFNIHYLNSHIEGIINADIEKESYANDPEGFPSAIANIEHVKQNLLNSNRFFSKLHKNKDFVPVVKNLLYYKTSLPGTGGKLNDQTKVVIDYAIYDHHDHLLTQNTHSTVHLTETISGFAHGLKGMRINETREIYIHPAVGYGLYTSLEKGGWIKAIVTLYEKQSEEKKFPPLSVYDLNFILSEEFYQEIEKKHRQALRDLGIRAGNFISLISQLDRKKVAKILTSDFLEELNPKETTALTNLFWNFYFSFNL